MSQNQSGLLTGQCQSCQGAIEFPASMNGEAVECPHCQIFTVLAPVGAQEELAPVNSTEPTPTPAELNAPDLAGAFRGEFAHPKPSIGYSTGLVLVAGAMLLMPVIYLMLIVAMGGATLAWAAIAPGWFFSENAVGFPLLRLAFYVAPMFAGCVMIVFMIKPLFAGRPRHAQPLALHPAVDQRLFTLVTQICQRVGAPFPARIDVCCELTASASFRRGVLSFLGNDLVLTLGMPLVAGLTVEQLTVVLAHELGHFSQGFGMRLTYLIRTINTWLIRVAYQRDDWDYALEEWAQRADPRFRIIIVVAQLGVWFSRWILKGLVYLGHFIGCFMMREMEYHADLFGIRIGGSNAFESMIKRLHVLEYVLAKTSKDIRPAWNINKTLPENLPTLVALQESRIPGPVKVQIEDTAGIGTTHWFHSHPCSGDRIRRSRMAADPGMFRLSAPASSLFANFEVLSKQVTSLYYSEELGIPLALAKLRPSAEYVDPR